MAVRKNSAAGNSATGALPVKDFDIVIAGDFSVASDIGLRACGEAHAACAAGYRIGLLHLPMPGPPAPIAPEVQAAVRRFDIPVLAPDTPHSAKLLILHAAFALADVIKQAQRISAGRSVIVCGEAPVLLAPDHILDPSVSLAPANAWTRPAFPKQKGVKVERENWPLVAQSAPAANFTATSEIVRVGIIVPAGNEGVAERLSSLFPGGGPAAPVLWMARAPEAADVDVPAAWTVLEGSETSLDWFLRKIDALVVIETRGNATCSDAIVGAALAAGMPVVLPPGLARTYRGAVVSAEAEQAIPALLALRADGRALAKVVQQAKTYAARYLSEAVLLGRLEKLIGSPKASRKQKPKSAAPAKPPRVLFLPKGGVGLGHVARTLAIARRAGDSFQPVFVTLAESAGMIETFGFRAEYIPSAAYAGLRPGDWEPWFQAELEDLIDAYEADAVVFDGSDPSGALIAAVSSRRSCKLAWVRRGMWEAGYDPSLDTSRSFDLIIEPGEIAAARDRGATAGRRHEAAQVSPITVLEKHELLSREEAARAIGFDPARPAVLLQLGSGENRDIIGTLDRIIAQLGRYPGVQIAIAEWSNTPGTLQLWKGVKILKGAPLSLYFNAFDFTIAASGYNTFHETIGFGLPSIFIPNTAPGMDDQQARAQFAQDAGAAIELPQADLADLPDILKLMMQDSFRAVMRQNCESLYSGNGAAAASALISQLVN